MRAVGKKHIFLFGRFIACISTYLHAKFKIICQGEVCKIDKSSSLFIKSLKKYAPGKDRNGIFFSNLKYLQYRLVSNFEKYLSAITVAEQRL